MGAADTGRSHWVIDFQTGYGRWTQSQQRRYSEGLNELLAESSRDVPTLRFAIASLARLAFAKADALIGYTSDPRPPVREIAIRALPWLDARQGVPTLIDCLGDARARWAIYALRKVFSEMRPIDVLAALRDVPTTKVTVAKEVVRLLGELEDDGAYRSLLAMYGPDTHRDVRIAILRALWDHLEEEQTWEVWPGPRRSCFSLRDRLCDAYRRPTNASTSADNFSSARASAASIVSSPTVSR